LAGPALVPNRSVGENWAAFMQEGSLGLFSARLRERLFSYPAANTLVTFIFGFPQIGFELHYLWFVD
jgi:hypothetical protein